MHINVPNRIEHTAMTTMMKIIPNPCQMTQVEIEAARVKIFFEAKVVQMDPWITTCQYIYVKNSLDTVETRK